MNLLRCSKDAPFESEVAAGAAMNFIQVCENDGFVIRERNARNAPDKSVSHRQLG
jgi:hypothetical protein